MIEQITDYFSWFDVNMLIKFVQPVVTIIVGMIVYFVFMGFIKRKLLKHSKNKITIHNINVYINILNYIFIILLVVFVIFYTTGNILAFGVTAEVKCSDGNDTITSSKTISIGDSERFNDINIGLISSSGSSTYGNIFAEIMIDGKQLTLSNSSSSKTITFFDKEYEIELTAFTNQAGDIKVKGGNLTISEGETIPIKSIYVHLKNIEQNDDVNLRSGDFIIGYDFLQLNTPDAKYKIIEYNNKSYIIDLTSAHGGSALITSYSCISNILYIEDETSDGITVDNSTSSNQSSSGTINIVQGSSNTTTNVITNNATTNSSIGVDNNQETKSLNYFLIIFIVVVIGLLIVIYIMFKLE